MEKMIVFSFVLTSHIYICFKQNFFFSPFTYLKPATLKYQSGRVRLLGAVNPLTPQTCPINRITDVNNRNVWLEAGCFLVRRLSPGITEPLY